MDDTHPLRLDRSARVKTLPYFRPVSDVVNDFVDDKYTLDHWKAVAKRAKDLCEEGIKKANAQGEGIEAKVECRAKTKESLREKLKMRDEKLLEEKLLIRAERIRREKQKARDEGSEIDVPTSNDVDDKKYTMGYENAQQIWDEIVDFAGVRVILFMPSEAQRSKVKKVIQGIWGKGVRPKVLDGTQRKPISDDDDTDESPSSKSSSYRPVHLGYRAEHYRVLMKKVFSLEDSYDFEFRDKVSLLHFLY